MSSRVVYLVVAFLVVFTTYFLRAFTWLVIYGCKNVVIYHSYVLITSIYVVFMNCILYDLYYTTHVKRLMPRGKSFARIVLGNYVLLALVLALIYYTYYALASTIIGTSRFLFLNMERVAMLFGVLALFTSLLYIGIASVKYVLFHRGLGGEDNVLKRFRKILGVFWSVKGSFIVWVLFGYIIAGLIGLLTEFLATSLPSILFSIGGLLSLTIISLINTLIMYFYYHYFIGNYIHSILEDLGVKE